MRFSRRTLLKRAPLLAGAALPVALAGLPVNAMEFGLVPNSDVDQTELFQSAINKAAADGRALVLPGGNFRLRGLDLPAGLVLKGVRGATKLIGMEPGPLLSGKGAGAILVRDMTLAGTGGASEDRRSGLISLTDCPDIVLSGLTVTG
ncbi:MAG: hypothetical protein GXP01_08320, partial [Alphaproteobacteria bacterium]|nr:hypothetical protein [Alphaproteobacteria bacterium]